MTELEPRERRYAQIYISEAEAKLASLGLVVGIIVGELERHSRHGCMVEKSMSIALAGALLQFEDVVKAVDVVDLSRRFLAAAPPEIQQAYEKLIHDLETKGGAHAG